MSHFWHKLEGVPKVDLLCLVMMTHVIHCLDTNLLRTQTQNRHKRWECHAFVAATTVGRKLRTSQYWHSALIHCWLVCLGVCQAVPVRHHKHSAASHLGRGLK